MILENHVMIIKVQNFWGVPTGISAKTATLVLYLVSHSASVLKIYYFLLVDVLIQKLLFLDNDKYLISRVTWPMIRLKKHCDWPVSIVQKYIDRFGGQATLVQSDRSRVAKMPGLERNPSFWGAFQSSSTVPSPFKCATYFGIWVIDVRVIEAYLYFIWWIIVWDELPESTLSDGASEAGMA